VEANVRANVPEARVMYIEPDVSRDRVAPPLVADHGMTVDEWIAETTGQLEALRRRETVAATTAAADDDLDELARPADIPDAGYGFGRDHELHLAPAEEEATASAADDAAEPARVDAARAGDAAGPAGDDAKDIGSTEDSDEDDGADSTSATAET